MVVGHAEPENWYLVAMQELHHPRGNSLPCILKQHMRFAPGSAEPEPAEANAEAAKAEATGSAEEEWLVRSGHQGVWHGPARAVRGPRPRKLVLSPPHADILRDSSRIFVDGQFCSMTSQ